MTLNHNCGYFSGVGSGIAGNVRVLYVRCGLKKRGFSVITKQTETKQNINY